MAGDRVSSNVAMKSSMYSREIASAESMPWSARWARSCCTASPYVSMVFLLLFSAWRWRGKGCGQAGEVAYARHRSLPIYPPEERH